MSHPCPGGCGETVPDAMLSCRPDWYWLPPGVRSEVWATKSMHITQPRRMAALAAAVQFYVDKGRTPPPEWMVIVDELSHQEKEGT